ncbi:MAG: ABC transporter permease [Lachnospiraceae bacterium]|nr:ABC transporter permease [Lachnospiraceae bacterium]
MRNRIVYHVTWQYMKQNRKRTLTAFLGIIFMVLLMTCVFVGKDTAIDYMEQVASAKDGKWHVSMYDVTEKELQAVSELPYVLETAKSDSYGMTELEQPANPDKPYLMVKAYTELCFDWMNIELVSGRLPEREDEIVISQSMLEDGAALAEGDQIQADFFTRTITGISEGTKTVFPFYDITIEYGETIDVPQDFPYFAENDSFREEHQMIGRQQRYTVVGVIKAPGFEKKDSAGYAAITRYPETDGAGSGTFNLSMKLDLAAAPPSFSQELREIGQGHEIDFNDYVLGFSGKSSDSTMNTVAGMMSVFFIAIIMLASMFLIYNVFNMSFEERSRYLGMLSSVGATGKQKRSSVYFEAFFLLVFALPLGILAGFGTVKIGMMLLQPFIGTFMQLSDQVKQCPVTLHISGTGLLLTLAVSIVTVLLSAYLPARKIGKIGPIECIRGNTERKRRQYPMNRRRIRLMGAEGLIAGNSLKYQRKKTRGIIGAAAVFMVILVVTAFGTKTVTRLVTYRMIDSENVMINSEGWDYSFGTIGASPEEYEDIKQEILRDEGVEAVQEWRDAMFVGSVPQETLGSEYWEALHKIFNLYYHRELSDQEFEEIFGGGPSVMSVLAVEPEIFQEIAQRTDTDMELLAESDDPAAIVVQDGEMSTSTWSVQGMEPERFQFFQIGKMTDLEKGELLPMSLYSVTEDAQVDFPLRIVGYASNEQLKKYVTFHSQELWVIVSLDTADQIDRILMDTESQTRNYNLMTKSLYLRMNDQDTGLAERLQELSDQSNDYYFGRPSMSKDFAESINSIIRILLYCFVLLTSVICLLNLYNAIRGRIAGRKREFAVMMSVGMTSRQIEKMLLYECAGILLQSVLCAVVVSTPIVLFLKKELIGLFGYVTVAFPWWIYLAAAGIAVVVVVVLTLSCYRREKMENILENVRSESV